MKEYELMTITKQTLGEDGARSISNQVKDLITSNKGKVLDSDFWGKRKFAYEINHEVEGYYEVIKFEAPSEILPDLKTKMNYIDGLIRYLVTAVEK